MRARLGAIGLLALALNCQDDGAASVPDAGGMDADGGVEDASAPCDGAGVVKGPWALAATDAAVTLRWEACRPGVAADVTIELEGGGDAFVRASQESAITFTVEQKAPFNNRIDPDRAGTTYLHEARVADLLPGTCYRYRMAAEPGRGGRFCTTRAAGASFRFAAIGDTSPGQGPATAIAAVLGKQGADFVVHGGDLQYYAFETWAYWFQEMRPFLGLFAMYPAIGNHEFERPTEREEFVRRYFGGAPLDGNDDHYRFESGGVWFFALNTEEPIGAGSDQATWLAAQLADASQKPGYRFGVVYFHKPIVTCGVKEHDPAAYAHLEPLFTQHKVALVLQSHFHGYERFELGERTYITTGGGGAFLQPLDENDTRPECASRVAKGSFHHAMVFDVAPGKLTGVVLDEAGAVRDRFEKVVP